MQSLWKKIVSFHQRFSIETVAIFYLSLIGILVFAGGLTGGPVFDDNSFIFKSNRLINAPNPWAFWISGSEYARSWPLSFSILWVLYKLVGLNYFAYNLLNLTLHIINSILFFNVTKRFFPRAAFFSALIFLIHPMQIETVCWIFQLKTILATLLFLLSFFCILKYKENHQWWLIVISTLLLWLSFESKPIAIFAPLFFHLLLVPKSEFFKWKNHFKMIPFWIVMIFSIQSTVLGIVFDNYERTQKRSFQGRSNVFFESIESFFSELHTLFNPDTEATKNIQKESYTTLNKKLQKDQFDHKERMKLFILDYQLNKNPERHLSWMLEHDPYNLTFAKNLTKQKDPFLIGKYFLNFIDKLIKKIPNNLSIRLVKVQLLLQINNNELAKKTFIRTIKIFPYSTEMEPYIRRLNLQTYLCKSQYLIQAKYCDVIVDDLIEKKQYSQALKLTEKKSSIIKNEFLRLQNRRLIFKKISNATDVFIDYFNKDANKKIILQNEIKKNAQQLFKYEPQSISLLKERIHFFPKNKHDEIRKRLITRLKENHHNKRIIQFINNQNDSSEEIDNKIILKLLRKSDFERIYNLYETSILNQSYFNVNHILQIITTAQDKNKFHFLIRFYQLLTDKKIISYSIDESKFDFYSYYLGDYGLAYKTYQTIKNNYPNSEEINIKMLKLTLRHKRFEQLGSILGKKRSLLRIFYQMIIEDDHILPPLKQLDNITSILHDNDAMTLAMKLEKNNRVEEAIIVFSQLYNKNPYDSRYFIYAKLLLKKNEIQQANAVMASLDKFQPSQKWRIRRLKKSFPKEINEKKNYQHSLLFPFQNMAFYFTHFLIPHFNSLVYDHKTSNNPIRVILLALLIIIAAIYAYLKKNYLLAKIFALFILSIFPILGFYYVPYMKFSYVADHWAYLAIAPLAIFLSVIILKSGKFKIVLTTLFLLFFSIQSFRYIPIFNNEHDVLKNAIQYAPDEYSPYMELGSKYLRKGHLRAAKDVFEQAYARAKIKKNILIQDRLLYLYLRTGENEKAIELTFHLAKQFIQQKNYKKAEQIIKKALMISPDHERLKKLLIKTTIDSPSE